MSIQGAVAAAARKYEPYRGALLALDFRRGEYWCEGRRYREFGHVPGATFSRASTRYKETAAGLLVPVASGVPGITDKGLLVEEARTNLLLRSQTLATTWTASTASISSDTAPAPDGTTTADTLTEDTTNAIHRIYQSTSYTSGTAYTLSVYAKNIDRGYVQLIFDNDPFVDNQAYANFDLINGAVGAVGSSATATITALANGWYRCTVTATADATISAVASISTIQSATDARAGGYLGTSKSVYLWGAQLEAGAFATSYIPTTTASATRAADDAVVTGLSVRDGFTYVHKALGPVGVSTDARSTLNDGTSSNQIRLSYAPTTLTALQVIAGAGAGIQTGTAAAGATLNSAVNSLGANARASINGGAVAAAAVGGSMPTLTRLDIGATAGGSLRYWNGYIRQIIIYPTAFTDAGLVAAST